VKLRGFVTPFGHAADEPDFEARTVVNISQVEGLLFATWWPAASDVVQNLSDVNFTLNLEGAGLFHHLNRAGVVKDLKVLDEPPIVEPKDDDSGLFQIVQNGQHRFFFTYKEFARKLAQKLQNSDVLHVRARGIFDDANSILTTNFAVIWLN
jgi:hypothetical protein